MRLLHTSDWHVGRTFHGADLLAEQESVLGGLADIVADERIDVVVVAGDIYDRAVPSAEAVGVYERVLVRIREAGAQLVVTPGNHDSAPRLGAIGKFAEAGGLHMRTRIQDIDRPVLLRDGHGEVALYGIPYLEPEVARHSLGISERGHTGVLTEAMNRVRADLAARQARSVVLAHAFVTGGEACDSERPIAVGGVEQVPGTTFDGVDYVALGHLHGAQELADHLRYSGSPVAYSFSEARQRKSVWLVDIDKGGLAGVERRMLPVPRPLAKLEGLLSDLLTDPAHDQFREHYLSITVTDQVRPVDALRRLQDRFPYAVHMEWRPAGGRSGEALRYSEAVRGRDDLEVACCFVGHARGGEPTERESAWLREALETVTAAESEKER
ncbi:exonuclease SbcCD subunit D [Kibdelosporangium aridum]|uniref:Nuclease SbcCD subunit D n=1 Tax=Kibdelosporangium aridum TaxID=2030 RepID=A0A1W2F131_KIBAR|nr:exonuclease SbcCD subunit D [Kibdelosporangium aridum]SMD15659.1 Exodeoxyribonuclease I subunit D [Kibdelosporangium aridum]